MLLVWALVAVERAWKGIVTSVIFGLLPLTRYLGAAAILAYALHLFTSLRNISKAAVCLVLSFVPLTLWMLLRTSGADIGNREIQFHPPTTQALRAVLETFLSWAGPLTENLSITALLIFIIAAYFKVTKSRLVTGKLVLFMGFFHLMVPLLSLIFIDASISLENRILAPLFILSLIYFTGRGVSTNRGAPILAIILGVCFLSGNFLSFNEKQQRFLDIERMYTGTSWQNSPTLEFLKNSSAGFSGLVTNGIEVALLFGTTQKVESLPKILNPNSMQVRQEFAGEINELSRRICEEQYVLLYFRRLGFRYYLPKEPALLSSMPIEKIRDFGDGALYSCRKQNNLEVIK